jgi:nitrite reductase/ring-hydroxylating ferredoxin subunit
MTKNRYVIGPDGAPITVADLPPKDTKRWDAKKKALVVCAVKGGLITISDACEWYSISIDEFLEWKRASEKHGLLGLRVTKS